MPEPEGSSAAIAPEAPAPETQRSAPRFPRIKSVLGRFGGATTQEAAGTPVLKVVKDLIDPIHDDRTERASAIDEIDMANTARRQVEEAGLLEFAQRYGYSPEQMEKPEFRIRLEVAFDAETRYLQEISRGSKLADQVSMHDVVEPELRAQWERHVSALRDFAEQEAGKPIEAVSETDGIDATRKDELVGSGV